MAGTVITLTLFPVIVLVLMGIVFGSYDSGVPQIQANQYKLNCPFPLQSGTVVMGYPQIVGTTLNYTVVPNNSIAYVTSGSGYNSSVMGAYFDCQVVSLQPLLLGINVVAKPYGATTFQLPTGFTAWLGDSIGYMFGKIPTYITLGYLYLQVPALVSGIIWFNLITGILLFMFVLGVLIIIRSGGIG